MINLKHLLTNKTAKKTITEESIGGSINLVRNELGVLTQLINNRLNKITDSIKKGEIQTMLSIKLTQIQTMVKEVQHAFKAAADAADPANAADADSNNNGFPDETESDIAARRANMGYGPGNYYQGD